MFKLMCLLMVANGVPILMTRFFGRRLNGPLDIGYAWPWDGRAILGSDKTWRGVVSSLMVTGFAGWWLESDAGLGFRVAAWSMAGDLVSSFCKRRLGIAPGGRAPGLDQIPESLLPLLAIRAELNLGVGEVAGLVAGFTILDIILSKGLFALRIRERPY